MNDNIDAINKYIASLRWCDFEIEEISLYATVPSIKLKCGEDIDMQGYEMMSILFDDVCYYSGPLCIRYMSVEGENFISLLNADENKLLNISLDADEKIYKIKSDVGNIYIGAKKIMFEVQNGVR